MPNFMAPVWTRSCRAGDLGRGVGTRRHRAAPARHGNVAAVGGQPVWIAADDGTRLCADLYLPPGDGPWPVLLEALPYRMHDVTASSAGWYRTLAAAGFAVCRLDLRGTGSSGGIAADEHPEVERDDLRTVIAWLGAQPWCTGRVGHVRHVVLRGRTRCRWRPRGSPSSAPSSSPTATDDRFTDDAHHTGGVLRAIDLVADATRMVAMNALPPVPAVYGDGWDDEWRQRIDGTEPWVLGWLRAPRSTARCGAAARSARGPDGAGYERITCPTMLIAGWADGGHTTAFGTVRPAAASRGACSPARGATPTGRGAARSRTIDADGEVIAFFDEHLRGGPAARTLPRPQVFVRRPARPEPDRVEHPGTWRQAGTWPPPGWRRQVLTPDHAGVEELDVVADVGTTAGGSGAGALPWVQPSDQRIDDARSLTHDWTIAEPAELAGTPSVRLRVRSSAPVAQVAVKLCDVLPDGTSALITRGLLNLTHRGCWPADGSGSPGRRPTPVVPGEWSDVDIEPRCDDMDPPARPRCCASSSPAATGPRAGRRRHRCGSGSTGRRPPLTLPVWDSAPRHRRPRPSAPGPARAPSTTTSSGASSTTCCGARRRS